MTESEIRLAMHLLDDEQKAWVNAVKIGRWYIGNDGGARGVFDKKSEAISYVVGSRDQCRKYSKVTRLRSGCYEVAVLDIDEDPREKFYHTYLLEKITLKNVLRVKEITICSVLPEEYFEPYSELYAASKAFSNGETSEEETLQKFKDLGYDCQ